MQHAEDRAGREVATAERLTFSMLSAFICRIKSSTGLRVISGGGNFSKSSKTAEEYSLSGEKQGAERSARLLGQPCRALGARPARTKPVSPTSSYPDYILLGSLKFPILETKEVLEEQQ